MLVIVVGLIDEYSLKANILYIGMKLRFSFLWVDFANHRIIANHWIIESFSQSQSFRVTSGRILRGYLISRISLKFAKFITTKISSITVTFTPHVHQEVIAFWWTQGCNGYGCQVQLWIALIQQKYMKNIFFLSLWP